MSQNYVIFIQFTGKYSGVVCQIQFERVVGTFVFQVYMPSMLLCLVATASVFIPSDIVPGRMALCVTTFLSLIALFNGARFENHTKAYCYQKMSITKNVLLN
jgi:hypothetical protein